MVFTEAMCPRGIFRVSIGEGEKETFIYSVHLQPLDGVSRAEARFKQLEQIKEFMDKDHINYPHAHQIWWVTSTLPICRNGMKKIWNNLKERFFFIWRSCFRSFHFRP